jgi:hypothetical protein
LPDVPLLRRLAYGFLAREGMRTEEMARLRWRDIDLEHGRVNLERDKTDDPRDWDLRPDVVEALKRWKLRSKPHTEPSDYVFAEEGVPLNVEHLAEQIRNDLRRVGVERPQLFEGSETRQRFRAHDLRATFVTIALATGKTETWVSDRTGHDGHSMIERYRRKARTWNLGPLGPLHAQIPELAEAEPTVRIRPGIPPKSTARVAKLADAADLGSQEPQPASPDAKKIGPARDPRSPEIGTEQRAEWQSSGNADPVEAALAKALGEASTAGRFDVVAQLALELEARRGVRMGKAVPLDPARRGQH